MVWYNELRNTVFQRNPMQQNNKLQQKIELAADRDALKKLKLVVVAYSHVEREMFATEEAYQAEVEVEERAGEVMEAIKKLGIEVKAQPGNQYFLTNLLVDQPSLVVNLVDTFKGRDKLQTSVPAALVLSNFTYTGADIEGMIIGNDRNLTKRLLVAYDIPTPPFQFIRRAGTLIQDDLGWPLIVKLNESGGSVGIDNDAVKETHKEAREKVDALISTYKIPVIVERFVVGPEVTVIVFDDGQKCHCLMAEKVFRKKPDGKHYFTSIQSYNDPNAYKYRKLEDEALRTKIEKLAVRAFNGLAHKDYAKFDVRVEDSTNTPYFTDSNPNTAFGPDPGLPFTEVCKLQGISFEDVLVSLLSKYAKGMK
jgi:D-alanine-D-alanine ligase